jgi:negative regulator of flagellin synthesis FlgM
MTIKINGNQGLNPLRQTEAAPRAKDSSKSDAVASGDKVAFSSVLQDVNRAREASPQADAARTEKLQALKEQIAEGTYRPDLNKVASSLLKFLAGGR